MNKSERIVGEMSLYNASRSDSILRDWMASMLVCSPDKEKRPIRRNKMKQLYIIKII